MKKHHKKSENIKNSVQTEAWYVNFWRPAMAWSYMAICLFDFIIAPTGNAVLITFYNSSIPTWKSLTLENGGIIHLAFGAILGVSAWGRTKETMFNIEQGNNSYPYPYPYPHSYDNDFYPRNNKYDYRRNQYNLTKNKKQRNSDLDNIYKDDYELKDNMHEVDFEDKYR